MFLNFLFFLFPFLIYSGIALQGISFYAIGISIPFVFFSLIQKKTIPNSFLIVGSCFLLLHIVFPITNFINYLFPNKTMPESVYSIQWKWPGVFQSNFPSSLFFGGLALILLSLSSRGLITLSKNSMDPVIKSQDDKEDKIQPLKSFLIGLSFASIAFLCALIYQHNSGIDLRSLFRHDIEYLGQNDTFQNGSFRVYGFYGHPLTAAGVTLTYAVFSWTLLWSWLGKNRTSLWTFVPFQSKKIIPILTLGSIAIANFIGLTLSGGRTATLAGGILFIIIPMLFYSRKAFFKISFALVSLSCIAFLFLKNSAFLERILTTSHTILKTDSLDKGNNRLIFWKVYAKMFQDTPFFGQGNYWLKQGVRDEYYNRLGYETLLEKFPAHNIYLEILGSSGIFGLLWILICLFILCRTLKKKILTHGKNLDALYTCFAFAFIANLIHGLTQNVFFDSSVVYIYICLITVCLWENIFKK